MRYVEEQLVSAQAPYDQVWQSLMQAVYMLLTCHDIRPRRNWIH